MNPTGTIHTVEWLGLRLLVPADWEIVRHAVNPQRGRLVWVDRRHQRLQLSWAQSQTAPDPDRLFADYQARDRQADADATFERLPADTGWAGYRWLTGKPPLTRAGRFDRARHRWIELVIAWPTGYDETLETGLLRSFDTADPRDERVRWRAFGLDVQTGRDWELSAAVVNPADVSLRFRCGRSEAVARRLGMPHIWYNNDPERFLTAELTPKKGPPPELKFAATSHRDHRGCRCDSLEPGQRAGRLLGRLRQRRDLVWECGRAHAVFQLTTFSPPKTPVQPAEFVIRCCGKTAGHAPAGATLARPQNPTPETSACPAAGIFAGAELLDAIPVRNDAARAEPAGRGLVVRVPLQQRWFLSRPFSWVMPFRGDRGFNLDRLGAQVWNACDGARSIETICEDFAARHHLSFHEARLCVMTFLRELTRHRLVAVVVPERAETSAGSPA
jgi:hypothetical protein